MSNFKILLNDILLEKDKTFKDLEFDGIISERSFYQYEDYTPYLPTVIKIANYLNVSLDYLTGRTTENKFRRYSENQIGFVSKINQIMKASGISQYKISEDLHINRSNFSYWLNGRIPKLETLIAIANYLNCSIDDFLYLE